MSYIAVGALPLRVSTPTLEEVNRTTTPYPSAIPPAAEPPPLPAPAPAPAPDPEPLVRDIRTDVSATDDRPGFVLCPARPDLNRPREQWMRKRADGVNPCPTTVYVPREKTPEEIALLAELNKCQGHTIVDGRPVPTEKRTRCRAWVKAGNSYETFEHAYVCQNAGYSEQALAICIAGRQKGKSLEEIAEAIAAIEQEQAAAAQQDALIQQQTAAVRKKNLLIYGGIGVGALALYVLLKKKKRSK